MAKSVLPRAGCWYLLPTHSFAGIILQRSRCIFGVCFFTSNRCQLSWRQRIKAKMTSADKQKRHSSIVCMFFCFLIVFLFFVNDRKIRWNKYATRAKVQTGDPLLVLACTNRTRVKSILCTARLHGVADGWCDLIRNAPVPSRATCGVLQDF